MNYKLFYQLCCRNGCHVPYWLPFSVKGSK